jgi:hypothetical protein
MARMILRDAILSYPNLFQPRAAEEGGQAKYSAAFVFADTDALKEFKRQALAMAQERWGDKLKGAKIKVLDTQHGPANFLVAGTLRIRLPWQDNAEVLANKGYPEGGAFINARSVSRPGLVGIVPGPNGKPAPITDESAVYPGVIVNVSGGLFAYDNNGNRGVSFGLGNVQIVRDGDRLDSRRNAADEFEADDTVADLADLTDDVPAGVDEGDDLSDLIG